MPARLGRTSTPTERAMHLAVGGLAAATAVFAATLQVTRTEGWTAIVLSGGLLVGMTFIAGMMAVVSRLFDIIR